MTDRDLIIVIAENLRLRDSLNEVLESDASIPSDAKGRALSALAYPPGVCLDCGDERFITGSIKDTFIKCTNCNLLPG